MMIAKHKAATIIAIGVVQGSSNFAWAWSDNAAHLGGFRVTAHIALAFLAMIEMLWGLDFYNHIDRYQAVLPADTDGERLAALAIRSILYKAPGVLAVGATQFLINVLWVASDASSELGGWRIMGHLMLASLAAVEMSYALDLWQRLRARLADRDTVDVRTGA